MKDSQMRDWILLLPPSETKAKPARNGMAYETARKKKETNSFAILEPLRQRVLEALLAVCERGTGLEALFELRADALDEALQLNRGIRSATTLPARDLYAGVLYEALGYKTLPKSQQELFDSHTLIVSGLFGLVRPTDRIPPYKLKVSANLGSTIGKVVNFWRGPVSEIVRHEVRGRVVWDFLPEQHRRMWDGTGELKARHSVKFVKRVVHQGVAEWKTISHQSKALKGALVRHLLEKNATTPRALQDFEHPEGYHFEPSLSVMGSRESELVFAAD